MKKSPSHFVNKVQPKHWLGPGSGHSFLFLSSLDRRRIRRILRADRLPLPVASKHVVRFMVRSQCLQVRQISHRDEQLLTFGYMLKKLSYAWFCGLPQGQDLPCTAASDETSGIRVIPVPKKVVSLLPFNERLASSKPMKEDEFKGFYLSGNSLPRCCCLRVYRPAYHPIEATVAHEHLSGMCRLP